MGVEACVNGVITRIASAGFAHWAEPIALDDYFARVSDFIIAGLRAQPANYSLNRIVTSNRHAQSAIQTSLVDRCCHQPATAVLATQWLPVKNPTSRQC